MNLKPSSSLILAAIFCIQIFQLSVYGVDALTKIYIVYLGEKMHDDPNVVTASHYEMLSPLFGRDALDRGPVQRCPDMLRKEEAVKSIVYSYKHGFSGFAAMLNESQAQIISGMPDVISVEPNRKYTTHTTHSWDFLKLSSDPRDNTLLQQGKYGEDIIIGVIDTGIWPESHSFDATGYGLPPKRWKGVCQTGDAFDARNCSNKIIGARWYGKNLSPQEMKGEFMLPRDLNSHGTHCASTAAGKPFLLKLVHPDIAAPGVNILAAVKGGYQFMHGTSMACPHVSGIVALLKSVHPDWSPSAIKFAIVTTAYVVDAYDAPIEAETTPRKVADPFDYGGGHIDPNRAADPGLIYDINPIDYAKFFNCTLGSDDVCDSPEGELYQLNVPSIVVPDLKDIISIFRTVTNVGPTYSTYKAFVQPPAGVTVFVEPSTISFDNSKSMKTFKVTFVANRKAQDYYTFGSLTWSDGLGHSVRIPIVVRTILQDFDG